MAWRFLIELSVALDSEEELTEEQVKEILHNHEPQISALEHIDIEDNCFQNVDEAILDVLRTISGLTHGIMTIYLPGIKFDYFRSDDTEPSQLVRLFCYSHSMPQFIFPIKNFKRILSLAAIFRNILEGRKGVDVFQETLQDLGEFAVKFNNQWQNPLHRQVWRLQDLRDGGGLGFTVELFFIVLEELFTTANYSSKEGEELHSLLYVSTFRIITSDWSKYKHSVGTQQLLLDMVIPEFGIIFRSHRYPTSLLNEFFVFLGNILEGQTGPHIDNAVQELSCNPFFTENCRRQALAVKALGVIAPARAPCSS